MSEFVPNLSACSLGLWVKIGSRDEPQLHNGITHFVEHAVFRGSIKHSGTAIANAFEEAGATVNAYTTKEYICFYTRVRKEKVRAISKLLLEMVLTPQFKLRDVERERAVILDEIKTVQEDPEDLLFELMDEIQFVGSGLAFPILGSEESLNQITVDNLFEWHHSMVNANNLLFTIAGTYKDSDLQYIQQIIESTASGEPPITEKNLSIKHGNIFRKKISTVVQTHMEFCVPIPTDSLQDKVTAHVLSVAFGEGMSSRLYRKVREHIGSAYNIYSTVQNYSDVLYLAVYLASDTRNAVSLTKVLYKEIDNLTAKPFTAAELKRAKQQILTELTGAEESTTMRISRMARNHIEGLEPFTLADEIASYESVTPEMLQEFSNRWLAAGLWNMGMVEGK